MMLKRPMHILVGVALFGMMSVFLYFSSLSFANTSPASDIISSTWINSEPLTMKDLRGKVVMVEKVKGYIQEHHIPYAVPIDNEFLNWRQYRNRYWPTLYLIDKKGNIQYTKIGEGSYEETEKTIQQLLAEPT